MEYYIKIKILQFFKVFIDDMYGHCTELDGNKFMSQGRCVACDATEVTRWIDSQIEFLNWCRK